MTKSRAGKSDGEMSLVGTLIGNIFTSKMIRQLKADTRGPTPIQQRLLDTVVEQNENPDLRSILYQHSVFCQTSLPYRNPGDEARTWERSNGDVQLEVIAGKAMHPDLGRFVPVGLPFGPKCRMILMHINQRAALFAARFAFAQRVFCAAAILTRASTLTVRFTARLAAEFAGMRLVALSGKLVWGWSSGFRLIVISALASSAFASISRVICASISMMMSFVFMYPLARSSSASV